MTLIEEWRWERPDENPLQPLWDSIVGYVKTEFERMKKEEIIREVIKRLGVIDDE